jgi:hypothetical protein
MAAFGAHFPCTLGVYLLILLWTALGVADRVLYATKRQDIQFTGTKTAIGYHLSTSAYALSVATNGVASASIAFKFWSVAFNSSMHTILIHDKGSTEEP